MNLGTSDPAGRDPSPGDLSDEIRATVDRQPGDIVRCTRVGDRIYRCNWWRSILVDSFDNPGMKGGQIGTTYRVDRSSFLEVTRGTSGLSIRDITDRVRRPPGFA